MVTNIERLVEAANDRLRKSRTGITLELRGANQMLYLRGTFPPKPGSNRAKQYQQKIALKVKATAETIKQAEATAKLVGAELNLGRFDWGKWSDSDRTPSSSVGSWLEKFEADYWNRKGRTNETQTTWYTSYRPAFQALDKDAGLTIEYLTEALSKRFRPNSQGRRRGAIALGALAKFAGLDPTPLQRLRGNYGPTKVAERDLPTDDEIEKWGDWVCEHQPGWRYFYGCIAVYGLRPHEVFHLDMSSYPEARVTLKTKTGDRPIVPLKPEWCDRWKLNKPVRPRRLKIRENEPNISLGGKVSRFFHLKPIPFGPYDLRHCYSRRCVEYNITPELASKLMGHDLTTHLKTYKRWVTEDTYIKAIRKILEDQD